MMVSIVEPSAQCAPGGHEQHAVPLPVSLPRPRRDVPKEVVGTTEGLIDK